MRSWVKQCNPYVFYYQTLTDIYDKTIYGVAIGFRSNSTKVPCLKKQVISRELGIHLIAELVPAAELHK